MNKVALVTGASSGIGMGAALKFIDEGFTVYAAARRTELMAEISKKGGKVIKLDLCDSASIKDCVETIKEKEGRIDVLVNNAGFGLGGSIEDLPMEEVRKQFDVNVFGLGELTQKVLPVMRNQKSGRIINISSMAGRFSSPFSGWYHATKYSVEAFSDALRMEVAPFGIKVVIIEPGMIQTDWGVIHGKNIRKYSGNTAYSENANAAAKFYETGYVNKNNLTDPKVISNLIVKTALVKNPRARYSAGKMSKTYIFLKKILPDCLYDMATRLSLKIK